MPATSKRIAQVAAVLVLGFSGMGIGGLSLAGDAPRMTAPAHATLAAFSSEAQLQSYLKRLHRPPPPPPPPPAPPPAVESVVVTGAAAPAQPSITNNQEANVDEGDIVKLHGDTLVVLRRGRLFTISLAHGGLAPVDAVNAYPPGVDAREDWYDEMLVSGDRVIVIGYSYQRGGTEINRFHIGGDGRLRFEDAYQLRSNDYYSSRNYASRLIGHQLILYSARDMPYDDPGAALPALRRWTESTSGNAFQRIGTAHEVYLSPGLPDDQIDTVHIVTSCDLTAAVLQCKATSVLGPDGHTFYVAADAVYVWVAPYWTEKERGDRANAILYRLPLDGGAPSAIGVRGAPVDQFSFREDAADGVLNVIARSGGSGDAMWASDNSDGATALLRIPLGSFGDGMHEVARSQYRMLPVPKGGYSFHNRFAGDYVLYGFGNDWGAPEDTQNQLVAVPVRGGPITQQPLPHGVDRIEIMGRDAVVVGSDQHNVYFSTILLASGDVPALGDRYTLTGASQAETRSHGFFFQPSPDDANGGVLGLPVARPAREGFQQLFETSAAMVFLRRTNSRFRPLGELDAHPEDARDDSCVASCDDWYGNARPIFIRKRTFALMGYELVEGTVHRTAIQEIGRVNFAPAAHAGRVHD